MIRVLPLILALAAPARAMNIFISRPGAGGGSGGGETNTFGSSKTFTSDVLIKGNAEVDGVTNMLGALSVTGSSISVAGTNAFLLLNRSATTGFSKVQHLTGGVLRWSVGTANVPAGGEEDYQIFDDFNAKRRLYISQTNGNVGLGTDGVPTHKVHISSGDLFIDGTSPALFVSGQGNSAFGTASGSSTLRLYNTTNNNVLTIESNDSTSVSMAHLKNPTAQGPFFDYWSASRRWAFGINSSGNFVLRDAAVGTDPVNGTTLVTVTNTTGKVGIGTVANVALDVVGDIAASASIAGARAQMTGSVSGSSFTARSVVAGEFGLDSSTGIRAQAGQIAAPSLRATGTGTGNYALHVASGADIGGETAVTSIRFKGDNSIQTTAASGGGGGSNNFKASFFDDFTANTSFTNTVPVCVLGGSTQSLNLPVTSTVTFSHTVLLYNATQNAQIYGSWIIDGAIYSDAGSAQRRNIEEVFFETPTNIRSTFNTITKVLSSGVHTGCPAYWTNGTGTGTIFADSTRINQTRAWSHD